MASPTLDWAPPEAATAQTPPADTWQPPEVAAEWTPPEAQAVEVEWMPPELEQGPVETFARTAAQDLGSLATGAVSGLGRWFENLSGVANQAVPGLGDVLDYAPQSALFQALAPVADDLRQEAETVYAPDAQRNPIASTIGGGVGQAVGMIPMIATGGTPLVLGAAAASGFGEGSQTAEELGVQNPAGQRDDSQRRVDTKAARAGPRCTRRSLFLRHVTSQLNRSGCVQSGINSFPNDGL